MSLPNLLTDSWIHVTTRSETGKTGSDVISVSEITRPDIVMPDFGRADLNMGCLELLTGILAITMPPENGASFHNWLNSPPSHEELRKHLSPFDDAFNILDKKATADSGATRPLFMQDFDALDNAESPSPVNILFLDGMKNDKNRDIFSRQDRYETLDPYMAALVLYTHQTYCSSGGVGYRTSMRGGGPMTVMVSRTGSGRDEPALWERVWPNVPFGAAKSPGQLPWMKPTVASKPKDAVVTPDDEDETVVAFFGMPRRIRLVTDNNGLVTGFRRINYGNNYSGFIHPLTPYYYSDKEKAWLPGLMKSGFFYNRWPGILMENPDTDLRKPKGGSRRIPRILKEVYDGVRDLGDDVQITVFGYEAANATIRNFVISSHPKIHGYDQEAVYRILDGIEAAGIVARNLQEMGNMITSDGFRNISRGFYERTEWSLDRMIANNKMVKPELFGQLWLDILKDEAFRVMEILTRRAVEASSSQKVEHVFKKERHIRAMLSGRGKIGAVIHEKLGLDIDGDKE